MKNRHVLRNSIALFLGLLFLVSSFAIAADEVKIGVLAKRGAKRCFSKWGPTGDYLTEKIGQPCRIVPLKFDEVDAAVSNGDVDFFLGHPGMYSVHHRKYNSSAIATMINSAQGKPVHQFGAVLFTLADSPINSLEDMRGKSFMWVKRSAFGGAQVAWRLLVENGINPETDCAKVLEGNKHDNVVMAILNGAAEVGTVRSDCIERMEAEGKCKLSDFKIIHQIQDDFPFVHSTQLYPEWPMAKCAHTDDTLAKQIAQALIAMPKGCSAATSAKVVGWVESADYTPVIECLETIDYGVFSSR